MVMQKKLASLIIRLIKLLLQDISTKKYIFIVGLIFSFFNSISNAATLTRTNPNVILPNHVAVVVNSRDVNSLLIGEYYLKARNIPKQNLITVDIAPGLATLTEEQFSKLKESIFSKISADTQVIVLTWTRPFAVNCNSITSAITMGYQPKQCENGCGEGVQNPYFNNMHGHALTDFNMRLSILLPTDSVELAKNLIDRGVLSAFKINDATAYFLKTSDPARSKPREAFFPKDFTVIADKKLRIRTIKADSIKNKSDVMFYFTGAVSVPHLETIGFLPGAIADHLTSSGGVLYNDAQMSSLKWLEAGATGSYGAVSEPCNYWQKFPNPAVLVDHYLRGDTLIEAYWKSVAWPTQGLFIGEPLAAPYKSFR